jgi:hypothetical protein
VPDSAIGKDAETYSESQAGLAVARGVSVVLTALLRRRPSAGLAPRALHRDEGEDFQFLVSKWYHFAPGEKMLLHRPKPFSHMRLRRADEPELGGGALCGSRRGDFGPIRGRHTECACCKKWSGARFRFRIRPMPRHLDRASVLRVAKEAESESVRLRAARSIFSDMMMVSRYSRLEARMTELEEGLLQTPMAAPGTSAGARRRRLPLLLSASGFDRSRASPTMRLCAPAPLGCMDLACSLTWPGGLVWRGLLESKAGALSRRTGLSTRAKARREKME